MSIWGVTQSLSSPVIATAASDVACPAATETNCLSASVVTGISGMNAYIEASLTGVIVLGATPPTALAIALRIGSNVDSDIYTVPPAQLVANAVLQIAVSLVISLSRSNGNASAILNVTANPTGQAVTFKAQSRVVYSYALGADL